MPLPQGSHPAFISLQKSALIVQGPREVKKRELVFLQFRLNKSSEDFSAIDYLLFSSFQEFMQRWPESSRQACIALCILLGTALQVPSLRWEGSGPGKLGCR